MDEHEIYLPTLLPNNIHNEMFIEPSDTKSITTDDELYINRINVLFYRKEVI